MHQGEGYLIKSILHKVHIQNWFLIMASILELNPQLNAKYKREQPLRY